MTLSEFIDFVRNRHNAASDTNWSDSEIRALITARANEALSFIGLIESSYTDTSVANTATYNYPSYCVSVVYVRYNGRHLKKITFQQYMDYQNSESPTTGTPTKFTLWNDQIYLYPTPDTSSLNIVIYFYKEHPTIDAVTQTTIDIPSVLHPYLANGVIADMFAKDINNPMFSSYESKWENQSIPRFLQYKADQDSSGGFSHLIDPDSEENFGWGGFP